MTLKTLAAAACLIAVSATASLAATFTVNGTDFDVTTIEGTFSNNQSLLESQIWWGNVSLAYNFAEAVKFSFGNPNFFGDGPYFAYQEDPNSLGSLDAGSWSTFFDPGGSLVDANPNFDTFGTFAIATPVAAVPLPAGGLLLLTGLGGVAALKRRKKRTA